MTLNAQSKKQLDNLVKIQKLKEEAADQNEFNGMLSSATQKTIETSMPIVPLIY